MVGVPVIINHKDITADNADDLRVGVVSNVWFDEHDGWYWCDGVIWDETAQNLITDKGWSVSCSYDVKLADDTGGTENNIPYDIEFLDGVFTHLAIVNNPRYERANIVFNSKTALVDNDKWITKFDKDGNPYQFKIEDGVVDLTDYFEKSPTIEDVKTFLNKMVEQGKEFATSSPDWLIDIPQSSKKRKHITYSSQYKFMSNAEKRRHNKYILALEDLLKNTEYLNEKTNTKPLEKPNTEKYHYFKSNVRIGEKTYKIIFDTEEFKSDSKIKPQTVHLYDVREVKNSSSGANDLMSVKNPKEESNNIITDNQKDFNPDMKNNEANNNKEQDMALLEKLKELINNVENDKGEGMDNTIENEKVDKRKLIDEVAGIMKSAGADDEKIRTAIAKMEKLAYDKSEAGTADNACDDKKEDDKVENKKADNETQEDEKKYEELKKDVKEDAENKCKNSVENAKSEFFDKMNEIFNAAMEPPKECLYVSRQSKLEAAKEYFG